MPYTSIEPGERRMQVGKYQKSLRLKQKVEYFDSIDKSDAMFAIAGTGLTAPSDKQLVSHYSIELRNLVKT